MNKHSILLFIVIVSCTDNVEMENNDIKKSEIVSDDTVSSVSIKDLYNWEETITIFENKERNYSVKIPKKFQISTELIERAKSLPKGHVTDISRGDYGPQFQGLGFHLSILDDDFCKLGFIGEGGDIGGGRYLIENGYLVAEVINLTGYHEKCIFDSSIDNTKILFKKFYIDIDSKEVVYDYNSITENGIDFIYEEYSITVDIEQTYPNNNSKIYTKPDVLYEVRWYGGEDFTIEKPIYKIGYLKNDPSWIFVKYPINFYGDLISNDSDVNITDDSVLLGWIRK